MYTHKKSVTIHIIQFLHQCKVVLVFHEGIIFHGFEELQLEEHQLRRVDPSGEFKGFVVVVHIVVELDGDEEGG